MINHEKIANAAKKFLFTGIGIVLFSIGLLGIIMPIFPGIPFFIAAGFIFYKVDENSSFSLFYIKLHNKIKNKIDKIKK